MRDVFSVVVVVVVVVVFLPSPGRSGKNQKANLLVTIEPGDFVGANSIETCLFCIVLCVVEAHQKRVA